MKKLLFLLLASFLVLAACGNEEESEDKKETKASDKESKKEDKKSDEDKEKDEEEKSEDKSNEEVATQDENSQQTNTQEQQSTEEPVQSQEQVNTQEQQPTQQEPQQEDSEFKDMPNGDAMFDMPGSDGGYYSNDQLDPETGLPKDDAVPHEAGEEAPVEEESDWVKGQDEWLNASESEKTEIRKADAEKYGYEYDPSDYE